MKASDLKFPTSWENRYVLIKDRVWYVPTRTQNPSPFEFPGWSHPDLFGNSHPVCVEYCSGNGAWIASKAAQFPLLNWVAVEMKFDRVRKIWAQIKRNQLTNLIIVCGEALNATKLYFPSASFQCAYINFPDPWPKRCHIKNRLIQIPFLNEVHRVLQPGRAITFVTDDPGYSDWSINQFLEHPGFESEYSNPSYVTENGEYGITSYFEQLWRDKGKTIRYHRFKKIGGEISCLS